MSEQENPPVKPTKMKYNMKIYESISSSKEGVIQHSKVILNRDIKPKGKDNAKRRATEIAKALPGIGKRLKNQKHWHLTMIGFKRVFTYIDDDTGKIYIYTIQLIRLAVKEETNAN